jgi:hypothetical protein
VAEQIYTCGNTLFCDDYVVGGGTDIGARIFPTSPSTVFTTLGANVGSPYEFTMVFTVAADTTLGPLGDIAGAILATPTDPVDPVPGPGAGAGLPGLVAACAGLLGLAPRRRRRQLA